MSGVPAPPRRLRGQTRRVRRGSGCIRRSVGRSCEDVVGHIEDVLELAVPRDQTQRFVEHRDAVAHVLEGDAEFVLALARFRSSSRAFSIAITACAAKFSSSAICLSENGRTSWR